MSGDPKLTAMTKLRLGAFASEMALANPSQAGTIFSLQDTLEQRLPMALQNEITLKLNKDAKGTLAEAKKLIEKDPKLLDEVNKDPTKLATIMGIKTPAPAANPATPQSKTAEPAADKPANAPAAAAPAAPKTKTEPAAVVAAGAGRPEASNDPKIKAPAPLSKEDIALRTQIADASAKVTKMQGFEEFSARAEKSQSLGQAVDAMMGKKAATPQEALAALQDIQKDPDFFNKANKGIDQIPEQMRESVFTHIAEDPDGAELGRAAMAGQAGAKSELMTRSFSLDSLTGGKGLSGLFSKDGMKNLFEMLASFLPMMMDMMKGAFEKLKGGLGSFGNSSDLLRMGNNPEGTSRLAATVKQEMGLGGNQRVVDASKPNDPATPVQQLGEAPKINTQGELRKFDNNQPAANEPPEQTAKRQANGFVPPGGP